MKTDLREVIINVLESDLETNKKDHQEYLLLRDFLKSYEGKKLTAKIQDKLPDGYKWGPSYNGPEIRSPRDKKHFVCYSGEQQNNFKIEFFDRANGPYNAGAKERSKKIEGILSNKKKLNNLVSVFEELSATWIKMNSLIERIDDEDLEAYHNPSFYDILRALNINSRILSDFKYGKKE